MPHAGEFIGAPSFEIGGSMRTRSPLGMGFSRGAGGTVTQLVSKATAVTLNAATGRITMHNASLAASTAVSFTWTNSSINATDTVIWAQRAGTDGAYNVTFTPSLGSCVVTVRNLTAGPLAEAFEFNFSIVNGSLV